jgi:hypothetical protein
LGASNTAFNALQEKAANRTAATNNSAGYGDLTAQLGREQAQTDASKAQQNQVTFANQQLKVQLAGLSALGQTYGADTNLLGKAMGVPSELLGVRQRASTGSSTAGLGGMLGVEAASCRCSARRSRHGLSVQINSRRNMPGVFPRTKLP